MVSSNTAYLPSSLVRSIDVKEEEVIIEDGYKPWLSQLHEFLEKRCGKDYVFHNFAPKSLQFTFKGVIDVDLLVSPNSWEKPRQFYDFLTTISGKGTQKKRERYPIHP